MSKTNEQKSNEMTKSIYEVSLVYLETLENEGLDTAEKTYILNSIKTSMTFLYEKLKK